MKTVMVTGGAGFIGTNFIKFLLVNKPNLYVVNYDKLTYAGNLDNLADIEDHRNYSFVCGDICDKTMVLSMLKKYDVNCIFNFAAESHVDRSIADPGIFGQTNYMGTLNLLVCARNYWEHDGNWRDGCLFYQISTDEVYGSLGETGYFTEQTTLAPHSPYSASKASADMLVNAWHDTYGMPTLITRCSNNYGPYQFPEKLIPLIIHNCLNHKPLPVYGDGMNVRDWLYVGDHCSAISMVMDKGVHGEVYNIGGHNERTNLHVVKTIIHWLHDHVDSGIDEGLIRFVGDRKGHDKRYGIDPTKIIREVGWAPSVSFEDGIQQTIQWYIDHEQWISNIVSGNYMQYYEMMYANR